MYILSIIIPHYNTPEKLERMLNSIPRRDDIQIIVVDDMSTLYLEKYKAIVMKYSSWVKFLENTIDNKGAGGSRNLGIENAKGVWVLFGDADDYFTENLSDEIEKYKNATEDVVFFNMTAILEGTKEYSDRCKYYSDMNRRYTSKLNSRKPGIVRDWTCSIIEKEIRRYWVSPCAKMVKRSFIEKNHIRFENVKYANDNFYSVQVGCLANKITASPTVVYCVTESSSSLTTVKSEEAIQIRENVWKRCLEYIDKNENKKVKFRAFVMKKIWGKA